MSLFKNIKTDESIKNETDSLGSSGPLDSGAYLAKISLAYAIVAASGATGVVLHLNIDKREIRQTLWITSGKEKGNKNYYETKDGERKYLPGFNLFQSLCLLTIGKEVHEMDTESKVIKLYNPETKKEEPTEVEVLVELLNQEIYAGILKQTVDKTAKGDDGKYHPTGESRDENEIDKFFRERDKMTTAEIRAGAEEPTFFNQWEAKWKGVARDRRAKTDGAAPAAKAGAPAGAAKRSLFA